MIDTAAHMPRIMQANLDRLFQRAVLPTLRALPLGEPGNVGQTESEEEFFAALKQQVDFHTAIEARKAMALVLAGAFERQVRYWRRMDVEHAEASKIETQMLDTLIVDIAAEKSLDLNAHNLSDSLREARLVANALKHGDGQSVRRLLGVAPHLWAHLDDRDRQISAEIAALTEHMRLSDADLVRYVRAMLRFWGLADKLPMAVTDFAY